MDFGTLLLIIAIVCGACALLTIPFAVFFGEFLPVLIGLVISSVVSLIGTVIFE